MQYIKPLTPWYVFEIASATVDKSIARKRLSIDQLSTYPYMQENVICNLHIFPKVDRSYFEMYPQSECSL